MVSQCTQKTRFCFVLISCNSSKISRKNRRDKLGRVVFHSLKKYIHLVDRSKSSIPHIGHVVLRGFSNGVLPHQVSCYTVCCAIDKIICTDITIDLRATSEKLSAFSSGVKVIYLQQNTTRRIKNNRGIEAGFGRRI